MFLKPHLVYVGSFHMAGFAHTLLHLGVGCHLRIGSDAGVEHDIGLGLNLTFT